MLTENKDSKEQVPFLDRVQPRLGLLADLTGVLGFIVTVLLAGWLWAAVVAGGAIFTWACIRLGRLTLNATSVDPGWRRRLVVYVGLLAVGTLMLGGVAGIWWARSPSPARKEPVVLTLDKYKYPPDLEMVRPGDGSSEWKMDVAYRPQAGTQNSGAYVKFLIDAPIDQLAMDLRYEVDRKACPLALVWSVTPDSNIAEAHGTLTAAVPVSKVNQKLVSKTRSLLLSASLYWKQEKIEDTPPCTKAKLILHFLPQKAAGQG